MVKVWFDALTAKQARIAAVLTIEGARRGLDFIITCRKYDYVDEVLDMYGLRYQCLGQHGESTREKLVRGLERQLALIDVVGDFDVHVSLTSPDAFRVAFGLNKPIVALTDTVHSYFVNKLTLPLADVVIAPSAIPVSEWGRYVPVTEIDKIRTFDGVFELMWIRRFKPSGESIRKLNLEPRGFVVIRFEESRASYYNYTEKTRLLIDMVKLSLDRGLTAVVFPRYPWQERALNDELGLYIKIGRVVIPRGLRLDGLDLAWHARLVVTGGSTMAHEAALLGTPSISYFPQHYYLDDYLVSRGLPLYRCVDADCLDTMRMLLSKPDVDGDVKGIVNSMEDPTQLIINEIMNVAARGRN
ncbi:DUF354 domain-containing protein [Vulcanisaeta thermophila]|uniref:DUF354 domain-containing protein n=1 Tax=Vulcanisaeta thermophila TaxID=867917 RepID=UPI000853538C|nr:DUF354 domain-containing protein [Vulcanisaeta thermophila]